MERDQELVRTDEKAEENSWEERVKRGNERNEWCRGETGTIGFFYEKQGLDLPNRVRGTRKE